MQHVISVLLVVSIVLLVHGRSPPLELCESDVDCRSDYCCIDPNAPLPDCGNSRKRQAIFTTISYKRCRPYVSIGNSCAGSLYTPGRVCGCAPGNVCERTPEPIGKRSAIGLMRTLRCQPPSGTYTCRAPIAS